MQTKLIPLYQESEIGQEAESILRNCVHCGFCNATCPSYQVLGDELDGPRGRIYLIKEMLEGQGVTQETRSHLDRCLTCRACETTCPSGVEYHRLLDIGRSIIEEKVPRSTQEIRTRKWLAKLLSSPVLFKSLLRIGQSVRPVLPVSLKSKIPHYQAATLSHVTDKNLPRTVLILEGCVQDALVPDINLATKKVFANFGIECVSAASAMCCGAVSFHLSDEEQARAQARANIDAWWPDIEKGQCEALIVNASGCGVFVKDYKTLLKHDESYRDKALLISALAKDPSEFLIQENWDQVRLNVPLVPQKVAFHPPCTLQHGQKINGVVEKVLRMLDVTLLEFTDKHLCCGSAGTYSILQPAISGELKTRKINALEKVQPDQILTANIGCQSHLSTGTNTPVRHWLEFVAEYM